MKLNYCILLKCDYKTNKKTKPAVFSFEKNDGFDYAQTSMANQPEFRVWAFYCLTSGRRNIYGRHSAG
jgi:hypothetical protein